jgi:hypothetical protein
MTPAHRLTRAHSSQLTHSRAVHWRLLTVADDSAADDAAAGLASIRNDANNASTLSNVDLAAASNSSTTKSSFVDVDVEAVKRAAAATVM